MIEIKKVKLENAIKDNSNVNFFSNNSPNSINNDDNTMDLFFTGINIPNSFSHTIFDPNNIDEYKFGGDQGNLIANFDTYINDPKIWEIVQKYYPETTAEDLELLFYRMNKCGCGVIAAINTLLFETGFFSNKYDYGKQFGFPYYSQNGYSYDYLFLDFFLYYAKEFEKFETIEEVYGNAAEQKEITDSTDAALTDDDFEMTGMDGTNLDAAGFMFKAYLIEKGIEIDIIDEAPVVTDQDDMKRIIERQKEDGYLWTNDMIEDVYNGKRKLYYDTKGAIDLALSNLSMVINVAAKDFTLYYPYDADGNGVLDDIYDEDLGSHAMTVVAKTDDPEKIVVSSWGKEFVMDVADINDYCIYDYTKTNYSKEDNNKPNQGKSD